MNGPFLVSQRRHRPLSWHIGCGCCCHVQSVSNRSEARSPTYPETQLSGGGKCLQPTGVQHKDTTTQQAVREWKRSHTRKRTCGRDRRQVQRYVRRTRHQQTTEASKRRTTKPLFVKRRTEGRNKGRKEGWMDGTQDGPDRETNKLTQSP